MAGKKILEMESPKTQTVEGVKALITYHNHDQAPSEMPAFYRLTAEMVLVLSNKKDSYYVVTPRTCSCPSATYRHGPCKHQRKFYPPDTTQTQSRGDAVDSIRPTSKWHGHNGPVAVF